MKSEIVYNLAVEKGNVCFACQARILMANKFSKAVKKKNYLLQCFCCHILTSVFTLRHKLPCLQDHTIIKRSYRSYYRD